MRVNESSEKSAAELHQQILDAARSRPIVAFALKEELATDVVGFVELQLGDESLSHAWIGYWTSAEHRDSGGSPQVVVACAPRAKADQLRSRLGIHNSQQADVSFAAPYPGRAATEFTKGLTHVIVLDRSGARSADQLDVELVADTEPYLMGWYEFASGGY